MNALVQRSAASTTPALRQTLAALLAAEPLRYQTALASAAAPLSTSEGRVPSPCGRLVEGKLGLGMRRCFSFSAVQLRFRASDIAGAESAVDDALYWKDERSNRDESLEISKLGIVPEIAKALANRGITKLFPTQESRLLAYRGFSALPSRSSLSTTTGISFRIRHMSTVSQPEKAAIEDGSVASTDAVQPQRIKFKRLDKTARHIMNILDKEEVEKVKGNRDIPDIKPGYIVQLKVVGLFRWTMSRWTKSVVSKGLFLEVPENKRRVSVLKGIVIARRNAGLHTTFRLRRMVAGVGVESVFPLYSPNIKEMKVLDKKDVRRAKLYYLRDRMNALKQK